MNNKLVFGMAGVPKSEGQQEVEMFYDDENDKPAGPEVVNMGSIQIEKLDPLKPGTKNYEIYAQDLSGSMGTSIGTNVMMLHMHFLETSPARYITLIHKPTGERIRITFPYEED